MHTPQTLQIPTQRHPSRGAVPELQMPMKLKLRKCLLSQTCSPPPHLSQAMPSPSPTVLIKPSYCLLLSSNLLSLQSVLLFIHLADSSSAIPVIKRKSITGMHLVMMECVAQLLVSHITFRSSGNRDPASNSPCHPFPSLATLSDLHHPPSKQAEKRNTYSQAHLQYVCKDSR